MFFDLSTTALIRRSTILMVLDIVVKLSQWSLALSFAVNRPTANQQQRKS